MFSKLSPLLVRKKQNTKIPGTALVSHLDSHLPKGEKAFPHNEHANVEKRRRRKEEDE